MTVDVKEDNLKDGLLSLVLAIVEIVRDVLKIQALKRAESGVLSEDECERLGRTLMELDVALAQIEMEQGVAESVKELRSGLDDIVGDAIGNVAEPERWQAGEEVGAWSNKKDGICTGSVQPKAQPGSVQLA